jgi:hypothetical protein
MDSAEAFTFSLHLKASSNGDLPKRSSHKVKRGKMGGNKAHEKSGGGGEFGIAQGEYR